ncbi:sensor histidine kinase [Haloglomus halophilum]|uniref:sensor histidine kinase n=1 Tax=Haloglomus halophilum TaxID=2962672 RepID=UPI0020C947E0|nr:HAMP domain-containing sensor histidine kinase [Haloglomus halophilum]
MAPSTASLSDTALQRASVAGLGFLLLCLSLANIVVSSAPFWLRLVESGLPVGLSLFFLAFGVVLWERGTDPEDMLLISAWGFSGAVVTGALAVWLLAVLTFQRESVTDPIFMVASSATVGATFGGAAGYYHAQLQQTTAELRQRNVRLDEFASIVSHDLRNPLGVASGGLQLAKETGDEADFERVEQAHRRMDQMIGELLTLSQEGRDVTDLKPVSLERTVERARNTVDADIEVVVSDETKLRADPERLTALFENLLRNAHEHAGADPTVTVGTLPGDEGFYVADDGPGIPPDERDEVFNQGYTTASGGTGIGLAIVRRIADAHGWQVEVAGGEDGGARFEFRV